MALNKLGYIKKKGATAQRRIKRHLGTLRLNSFYINRPKIPFTKFQTAPGQYDNMIRYGYTKAQQALMKRRQFHTGRALQTSANTIRKLMPIFKKGRKRNVIRKLINTYL